MKDNGVVPKEWRDRYEEGLEVGRRYLEQATLGQVADRIRVETQWLIAQRFRLDHPDQDRRMDAAWHYYHSRGVLKALRDGMEGKA